MALRLTTGHHLQESVAHLTQFLSALSPRALAAAPIDVHLLVADGTRNTALTFIAALYNASILHDIRTNIDIIPFAPVDAGAPVLFNPDNNMASDHGFAPMYDYVALGGTFDHLHAGHKLLLTSSLLHTQRKLRVGVASAQLLAKKKFSEFLQPGLLRTERVRNFVTKIRPDLEYEILEISDVAGGTDTIAEVQALVVSPETRGAVGVINAARAANSLKPLCEVLIDFVGPDGAEAGVSSSLLRSLEASRHP